MDSAVTARLANNLGVCYRQMDNAHEAGKFFTLACRSGQSTRVVAFRNLAILLLQLNRVSEARAVVGEPHAHHPVDEELQTMVAGRFTSVGRSDEAYAYLMLERTRRAAELLRSLLPDSVADETLLNATIGLLHLQTDNHDAGKTGYFRAAEMARAKEQAELARAIQRKMRLELARFWLLWGAHEAAQRHIERGLAIEGTDRYRDELVALDAELKQNETPG